MWALVLDAGSSSVRLRAARRPRPHRERGAGRDLVGRGLLVEPWGYRAQRPRWTKGSRGRQGDRGGQHDRADQARPGRGQGGTAGVDPAEHRQDPEIERQRPGRGARSRAGAACRSAAAKCSLQTTMALVAAPSSTRCRASQPRRLPGRPGRASPHPTGPRRSLVMRYMSESSGTHSRRRRRIGAPPWDHPRPFHRRRASTRPPPGTNADGPADLRRSQGCGWRGP